MSMGLSCVSQCRTFQIHQAFACWFSLPWSRTPVVVREEGREERMVVLAAEQAAREAAEADSETSGRMG